MIEIISPINLRDKLQVEDGDEITITFFIWSLEIID
jgi:CTP-dependent riboflavin kinase